MLDGRMPEIVPETVTLRFSYPQRGANPPSYSVYYIDDNNQYRDATINATSDPTLYTTVESVKVGSEIHLMSVRDNREIWMISDNQIPGRGDYVAFTITADAVRDVSSPITISLYREYLSDASTYKNVLTLSNTYLDYTDFNLYQTESDEDEDDYLTTSRLEISHANDSIRDIEISYTDREDTDVSQDISVGQTTVLNAAVGTYITVYVDPYVSKYHLNVMGNLDENMATRYFEFTMPDDDSSMTIRVTDDQIQINDLSGGLFSYSLSDFENF
jgi:hypothetical protein